MHTALNFNIPMKSDVLLLFEIDRNDVNSIPDFINTLQKGLRYLLMSAQEEKFENFPEKFVCRIVKYRTLTIICASVGIPGISDVLGVLDGARDDARATIDAASVGAIDGAGDVG